MKYKTSIDEDAGFRWPTGFCRKLGNPNRERSNTQPLPLGTNAYCASGLRETALSAHAAVHGGCSTSRPWLKGQARHTLALQDCACNAFPTKHRH
jgi:hypothetical protein